MAETDAPVKDGPADGDRGSDLLRARLERRSASVGPAVPSAPPGPAPLTPTQEALWFEHRVDPAGAGHHRTTVFRLVGALDLDALDHALQALVERHATLRTTYPMVDGRPMQSVQPAGPFGARRVDLRAESSTIQIARVGGLIEAASTEPFPLETEPPFGATVVGLSGDDHVLILAVHHLAIDGSSAEIVQRDLSRLYEAFVAGVTPDLPPAATTFADWASWSGPRTSDAEREAQLSWWGHLLAAPLPTRPTGGRTVAALDAGADSDSSTELVPSGLRPAVVPVPDPLVDALRALARVESVTLFAVLVSALQLVAHDVWGLDDLVVGVPVIDRGGAPVDEVIGCFVTMLPARFRIVVGMTGRSLIGRTGAGLVGALDHRQVTLGEIVAGAMPRDTQGRAVSPVLATAQLRDGRGAVTGRSGLRLERVPVAMPGSGPDLVVVDDGSTLRLEVAVPLDEGGIDEARRLGGHLVARLEVLVRTPDAPVGAEPATAGSDEAADRRDDAWTYELFDYPQDATIPELFVAIEAAHRDEIALVEGPASVTFGELGDRARALADELRAEGIDHGHAVGLDLDRSIACVVAGLATMMCGAAYVPLDPYSPPDRTAAIIEDAGISVVVGPSGVRRLGPPQPPPLPTTSGPFQPAYVIYTSGSTGRPKGVVVPHRGVVELLLGSNFLCLGPGEVIGIMSTPAFDASTVEMWGPVLTGARGVVIDRDAQLDPNRLERVLVEAGVTVLLFTTANFNALARVRPDAFGSVRDVLVGGEAVEPRWMRAVVESDNPPRLFNDYGPTEITMSAAFHLIEHVPADATSIPIGRSVGHTTFHIRDEHGRSVAPGLPGELYLGGPGVALGYLNRPELTAERFVPDDTVPPAEGPTFDGDPGPRLYRTGDMVVELPDGTLDFVGRVDGQVKIRGFRIELGEIEVALTRHPAVDLAAVRTWDRDDDRVLVAYLVLADGAVVTTAELRAHLRGLLPPYMVPARLEMVAELPLNSNAKVDRDALPEPRWDVINVSSSGSGAGSTTAPVDDAAVATMAALWAANLGLGRVDPDVDYYELGGHSLKAVALLASVAATFGVELTMADLVGAPTARGLAAEAAAVQRGEPSWLAASGGVIELAPGAGDLTPVVLLPPGGSLTFITDYRLLASHLDRGRRVLTLVPQGLTGDEPPARTVPTMVTWYLDRVRAALPPGPIVIGGHSLGGALALEAAAILAAEGYRVEAVVMLDTQWHKPSRSRLEQVRREVVYRAWKLRHRLGLPPRSQWFGRGTGTPTTEAPADPLRPAPGALADLLAEQRLVASIAMWGFEPPRYGGRVIYLQAAELRPGGAPAPGIDAWSDRLGEVDVRQVPGQHNGRESFLREPHVAQAGAVLAEALTEPRS